MNITLLQYDTEWMDPEANLEKVRAAARKIRCDRDSLIILPEMFNTGYTMHPEKVPTEWQDMTIKALTEIAAENGTAICGSIPFYKNGQWFNTFILVDGENHKTVYNKVHLFTPAGEKNSYTPGDKTEMITYQGWKILPLICYDLRFPYLSFTSELPDLIIYTANWPEARIDHWVTLLKARAVENQCYVAGVNRTGSDNNGFLYPGKSMVIDFSGKIILQLEENPASDTIILQRAEMESYRKKLPFFEDRKL